MRRACLSKAYHHIILPNSEKVDNKQFIQRIRTNTAKKKLYTLYMYI